MTVCANLPFAEKIGLQNKLIFCILNYNKLHQQTLKFVYAKTTNKLKSKTKTNKNRPAKKVKKSFWRNSHASEIFLPRAVAGIFVFDFVFYFCFFFSLFIVFFFGPKLSSHVNKLKVYILAISCVTPSKIQVNTLRNKSSYYNSYKATATTMRKTKQKTVKIAAH